MALTKDGVLAHLQDQGIAFQLLEHADAATPEAQVQVLSGNPGVVAKSLVLKDKKKRLYLCAVAADAKLDLKVLSARLGLGKGGVSMANPEDVEAVLQNGDVALSKPLTQSLVQYRPFVRLQVAPQCATPLALCNSTARHMLLLLDQRLQSAECLFVPALTTCASVALAPSALEAFVRSLGREPNFVDFTLDPKIDRDNPPDLKYIVDAAPAQAADASSAPPPAAAAVSTPAPAPAAAPSGSSGKASSKAAPVPAKAPARSSNPEVEIAVLAELLLGKVSSSLVGSAPDAHAQATQLDPFVLKTLRADLEMQLNGLRNASFAAGYKAGKGELVAAAEKRYA